MNLLRPFADAFLAYCLFAQWILRTTNDAHTHQMTRLETDEDDEKKSWKVARFDWSEMHTENEKFAFYSFILLLCNVCPDFFIRNCSDCRNGQKEKKRKRRMVDDDENREKDISQQITSWNAWKRVVVIVVTPTRMDCHKVTVNASKWRQLATLSNRKSRALARTTEKRRNLCRTTAAAPATAVERIQKATENSERKKSSRVYNFLLLFCRFVLLVCSDVDNDVQIRWLIEN